MMMERRIGEQFKHNGKTLEVVDRANHNCEECFFFEESIEFCRQMTCDQNEREDQKDVYFKEVKK